MWSLLGLYLVYYLVLPLGFIFLIWKIWQKRDELKGASEFGSRKKNSPELKKKVGEMERLQVFFIIFLLLFIPSSTLISSQIQEVSIEYDRMAAGGFGQSIEYRQVKRQLGPSYDTESIISEMETAPSYRSWYIEDIREEVDLERLTRLPGRLAVYYLDKRETREQFVIITYSYFSPLPITRTFVFRVFDDEAFFYEENTIVYPGNPSNIDPF